MSTTPKEVEHMIREMQRKQDALKQVYYPNVDKYPVIDDPYRQVKENERLWRDRLEEREKDIYRLNDELAVTRRQLDMFRDENTTLKATLKSYQDAFGE